MINLINYPSNLTCIGLNSLGSHEKGSYCCCLGIDAGVDLVEATGAVIIGDGVRGFDTSRKDVLFFGPNLAIGRTLFGQPCNLQELVYYAINSRTPNLKTYEEELRDQLSKKKD